MFGITTPGPRYRSKRPVSSAHFNVLVRLAIFLLAAGVISGFAQGADKDGKLKIHVSPKQAYVFVDGAAIRDGSQGIKLSPGQHIVGVYNYGYTPHAQNVDIAAGKTTDLNVDLQKSGANVSGPFADIEIKGPSRAAVLLNGTTPNYFVGHVDEFDWNWIWHQRLLVHPGTYQVTVTREGKTIWSGPVTAKAGQQVTVYVDKDGKMKTKDWKEGDKLGPQPRFHAGIASATVPVAPVTAQLSAASPQVDCGQSTNLNWNSENAVDTSISNVGKVAANGDQAVTPLKTTTYEITAKGPGGVITKTVTVNVDAQPTASLAFSQPEIQYHKVGDKVMQDGSSTLTWSTANANSVSINPLGSETTNGSQTIQANPTQTNVGPINEDVAYTLTTTNACGGTATRTAMLHIVGSIDPPPAITLASFFYPTNYPTARHPKVGLVASERQTLTQLADHFKNYEQYDQQASLTILGHADVRGPAKYNMMLSERRANLAKHYLVSQGIAADKIQTRAEGKTEELTEKQVATLQSKDNEKPDRWMENHTKSTWLAYNRRVDVVLQPSGQESTDVYPNAVTDARILWERTEPSLKTVEAAAEEGGGAGHRTTALR